MKRKPKSKVPPEETPAEAPAGQFGRSGAGEAPVLRGAVDRFEESLAVIAFDDEQQLALPRAQMPEGARAGAAVVARLGPSGTWHAVWRDDGTIALDDGQSLRWPGPAGSGETWLTIAVDAADTAARQERVRGLLGDIFGESSS